MDLKINGKRALVTGSTSGIGEAIAKRLAAEGVSVVVHGRREGEAKRVVDEIRKAGGQASYAIGDLSVDSQAKSVATAAGDVDILVNNAGIFPGKGWFDETPEDWNHMYNVNVASMIRLNNVLVPPMTKRGWGRVIAIGSVVGTKPSLDMPGYSATKVANISLAVSLAQSLAGTGVTSNAVSPGLIMTGGIESMFDGMGVEKSSAAREKTATEFAPNSAGRAGRPQEIADAVAFLCSDLAGFITGQNLRVDGGYVSTVN